MVKTPAPATVVVDFPTEDDKELAVSHEVKIGQVTVRVLEEPHQWHLLRAQGDPMSAIRAYVHPDDFGALDSMLASRRRLPDDAFTAILNALVEKPTGHPTDASSAS